VFYALPKLENGDRIEVFWDGSVYEYEVERKQIKRPSQVPDELNKKYDDHQLTLMACYPLLSDAKRILVHAKLISVNGSTL
jgi:LPXTG-site transpeptidase (sortase) family protein